MSALTTERAQAALEFYGPLSLSPSAARRVGWESSVAHELRLRAVVESLEPLTRLRSLVDVGCGEGALVDHLLGTGFEGRYQGEDILHGMVERARERHPGGDFLLMDSLEGAAEADGVVCCGTLNTAAASEGFEWHQRSLTHLWSRAREVLVVVIAVSDRHRDGSMITSADLGALWQTARTLSPSCVVREDLNAGEAMLVLRRDRSSTVDRLLPGADRALDRAEVLAAAGENHAVLEALGHRRTSSQAAALRWALAAAGMGRVRDAETTLRGLLDGSSPDEQVRIALASVLLSTGRTTEAVDTLAPLSASSRPGADDANMLLVRHHVTTGDPAGARACAERIQDPWVRREADALLKQE